MRKFVVLISLVLFGFIASAQLGKVSTIAADTVNGNETIYLVTGELNKGYDVTIQALCTNVGGTSDGSIVIEGSLDGTSYKILNDWGDLIKGYGNDTLTIVNAAVGMWTVKQNPFYKIRLKVAGTASDSTLISPKYNQVKPYR